MTAVAGVVFAASNWNTYIRDNINATGLGVFTSGIGRFLAGTGVGGIAERTPNVATVATSQTTTTTTYTNLTTTGPAVTVTCGAKLFISIASGISNNTAGQGGRVGVDLSGATTVAASDTNSFLCESGSSLDAYQGSWATVFNTMTSGSNTLTLKYRCVGTGTATFVNRNISVLPF